MLNMYEIWQNLTPEEKIKFSIRYKRYAIIYNGKEVKKYAFLKQAQSYKKKFNSPLFNEICEIVDLWTGEQKN